MEYLLVQHSKRNSVYNIGKTFARRPPGAPCEGRGNGLLLFLVLFRRLPSAAMSPKKVDPELPCKAGEPLARQETGVPS